MRLALASSVSLGSVVDIRAGGAGWPKNLSSTPGRVIIFTSPYHSDLLWGPPSLLSNGYRELFPRVKRQGREADHSTPTSAEVKKPWVYTSTPPYVFMVVLS
jgi:hypothetical protein